MVKATKLTKRYGEKRVLNRIDVEVDAGGFLLVTGPNGSGKTTLLRVLAGLEAPTSGQVLLPDRATIGYLGHEPHVYRELTPLENLHLFGRLYRVPERAERIGMLLEPTLVVMDEPFNALDEAGSALLDTTLDDLQPRSSVILATHDPDRVERLATHRLAFA